MNRRDHLLFTRSRDTGFLGRSAVLIGLAALAVALLVSSRYPWQPSVAQGLSGPAVLADRVREKARESVGLPAPKRRNVFKGLVQTVMGTAGLPPSSRDVYIAFSAAALLTGEEGKNARTALQEMASRHEPPAFSNQFLGDIATLREDMDGALAFYRREVGVSRSVFACNQVVRILLGREDAASLKDFLNNPDYRRALDLTLLIRGAAFVRDPALLFRAVASYDYRAVPVLTAVIAVLSAFVWFVIVWKLCQIRQVRGVITFLGVLAVLSGVMSATVTLFVATWQEYVLGFRANGEMVNDIIVAVCGIGLREEVIKFVFFLPFVPHLYRRRDSAAMLFVASCVGLGFALQENLGYFDRVQGEAAVWGRFLTANFVHIALTGMFGLAFCLFLYEPRRRWDSLAGTFLMVVVAHGAYDAFIMVRELAEYSILSIIIFAYVAYQYFQTGRTYRNVGRQNISVLGVFVIGAAVLVGVTLVLVSWKFGFRPAIDMMGAEFIGLFPIAFLFIHQFRDE